MRFVDLFAGLGGFHVALARLGHRCVYACEIDQNLRDLYLRNFSIGADGDIRQVDPADIPKHDILCAGFPCQPFSKAGEQQGLNCPKWGGLFEKVVIILDYHRPRYVILENVPNLLWHDRGKTWEEMKTRIQQFGYSVKDHRLSPHQFGIPQVRERAYIVGSMNGLYHFDWPKPHTKIVTDITSALERNPTDARGLSDQVGNCLNVWQEFIQTFPKGEELPSYPIWSMEFGATYPFQQKTPAAVGQDALRRYKGSHGRPLGSVPPRERRAALPSHARGQEKEFPNWKIDFIRKNRSLYERHRDWIDKWMPTIMEFPSSLQKLEWNIKGGERDIWKHVIQFRASGAGLPRCQLLPKV